MRTTRTSCQLGLVFLDSAETAEQRSTRPFPHRSAESRFSYFELERRLLNLVRAFRARPGQRPPSRRSNLIHVSKIGKVE